MDCRCVEFDPTSRYLATASFDSTITIYDYEQQRLVTTIDNHEDRVHSLLKHEKVVLCRWHPFYPFILSTSADSTGRIFAPHSFL
jgi:WD40 repeat protein